MLVLSRKQNESIVITVPASTTETRIEMKLVDLNSGRARLGFEAPREVRINRMEIEARRLISAEEFAARATEILDGQ
jgi:carbon storage regulator CsrA